MIFDEHPSESDIDRELDAAFDRFDAAVSGYKRSSVDECFAIIDPYTASQIRTAAHRAEFAGPDFQRWTEVSRERAGYGAQDFAADPR